MPEALPVEHGSPYTSSQPSHPYPEATGQGGNMTRYVSQGQIPRPRADSGNGGDQGAQSEVHEQDMEIGYEDSPLPLTTLVQKFEDEYVQLIKEQNDAEDAENARHRERLLEINNQYQEKLIALRARQTSQRKKFLQESEAWLCQRLQAAQNLPRAISVDHHGNIGAPAMQGHRAYPIGHFESHKEQSPYVGPGRFESHKEQSPYVGPGRFESHREQSPYVGPGRSHGSEERVPFPQGRVYNNAGPRYY